MKSDKTNPQTVQIKARDLAPGMGIRGVTEFSSEYSYLDKKSIEFLKKAFHGAKVVLNRQKGRETIPIAGLSLGDEIKAIIEIPPSRHLDSLEEKTAELLTKRGLKEFVVDSSTLPAPQAATPAKGASPGKGKTAKQARQVAESNQFVESVEKAAHTREQAAAAVEEMFHQGRSGNYTTRSAMAAVEDIMSKDLSTALTAVAGLKTSDQTYAHCVDMSAIFHDACVGILTSGDQELTEKVSRSTLAAGFMHDVGKSQVPQDILESTERFDMDSKEMILMRKHVDFGAKILSDAGMDKTMINVAHYHHVKKDTSLAVSYPEVSFSEVAPLTRLAAVADVYQALIGHRNYKPNWVPGKAVQYLAERRGTEFDDAMLDQFLSSIGRYPLGSLVKISTGDLAFVVRIAGQEPERPIVVLVENARGERLGSQTLVDLMSEEDLSITEVIDHYKHYDESPDQAFNIFSSLNVV